MKIRTDFVTNSSSSSFCVSLKAEISDGSEVEFRLPETLDLEGISEEYFECEDLISLLQEKPLKAADELLDDIGDSSSEYYLQDPEYTIADTEAEEQKLKENLENYVSGLKNNRSAFIGSIKKFQKDGESVAVFVIVREYNAWGEFADPVPLNDKKLVQMVKKYRNSKKKEDARKALIACIETPDSDRCCGAFGKGFDDFRYKWSGNPEHLEKLVKDLSHNRYSDPVYGREITKIDYKNHKIERYAEFDLTESYEQDDKEKERKQKEKDISNLIGCLNAKELRILKKVTQTSTVSRLKVELVSFSNADQDQAETFIRRFRADPDYALYVTSLFSAEEFYDFFSLRYFSDWDFFCYIWFFVYKWMYEGISGRSALKDAEYELEMETFSADIDQTRFNACITAAKKRNILNFREYSSTHPSFPKEKKKHHIEYDSDEFMIDGRTLKFYRGNAREVFIPDGVERIYDNALNKIYVADWDRSTPVIIHIPASVKQISDRAFDVMKDLKQILVDQSSERFISEDGILYNARKTELIKYPGGREEELFKVPSGILYISRNAFSDAKNLKEIIFQGRNIRDKL